jgi:DNA-binding transcriptional MerR regulator
MAEDERLRTLEDLEISKKEITNMLERLPVGNRTLALDKRRRELEERLMRIERAIETFSKKTVYIAL